MSLIIYFTFFILYNIYSSQTRQIIQFDSSCSSNRYYNSLNYACELCSNGILSPFVCYTNRISIYTFEPLITTCRNGDNMTELDGNGKLLETPTCNVKKEFNYSDIDQRYVNRSVQDNRFSSTIDRSNIFSYTGPELNYFRRSCLEGYYERGCDYSANLCALSLYSNENPFCEIITKLNANLNNIDNIL